MKKCSALLLALLLLLSGCGTPTQPETLPSPSPTITQSPTPTQTPTPTPTPTEQPTQAPTQAPTPKATQQPKAAASGNNVAAGSSAGTASGASASGNVTQPASEKQSTTVYITKTGSKYHRSGCRYLSKSKIAISLEDAKASYDPCSVCKPG